MLWLSNCPCKKRNGLVTRLSRDDWLREGLHFVARQGIEAVTIEALCQLMNVTKGSFYHHFENVADFRLAMLDYWETHFTKDFIAASGEGETPQRQLARLVNMVKETYGSEETAMRAWAQTDPEAQAVVARVDQQRLEFLGDLLRDSYTDVAAAPVMARLFYAVLLGAPQMLPPVSRDDFADMYDLLMRLHASLATHDSGGSL